ncbi:hypothetical protein ACFVU2_17810 [Leifsonia sp. NPDC058194]|uniref:hypothetical protein n=1 Tax=Leifsonia sp. NPDC058194 TaxID=3346374 RepID=UPI0036DE406F
MTDRSLLPDDSRFEELKGRLLDTIAADDRRRTRRHRLAAIGIAGALVAGTTAGGIAIARASQGQINYLVDCYDAADLGSRHGTSVYLPGDLDEKTPTPIDERVALAEEQCAAGWRAGDGRSASMSDGKVHPVPHLETCQLPDGRLAVFPSEVALAELCAKLGLSVPRE